MSGNSIGRVFTVLCFGESHGRCVGAVVDGCPSGMPLSEGEIQDELDRRKPGMTRVSTPRGEADRVELLSGVFNGFTTGAPICMLIWNREFDSEPYEAIKDRPRPGHADYPARVRYGGYNDYRGGGRFSGRMTAPYVMAGAVAKKLLKTIGVKVLAHAVEIGGIRMLKEPSVADLERVYENSVRCADIEVAAEMEAAVLRAKESGDGLGGIVEGMVIGVPAGVGDPLFDSLDADLAKILFNIPGVKGVEFGAGFKAARLKSSENNDQYALRNGRIVTATNMSGGILGGLTTGMPIRFSVAFKPPASIRLKQKTVDLREMKEVELQLSGRHDPCIVPRAVPVVEAAAAITVADHSLRSGLIKNVLG